MNSRFRACSIVKDRDQLLLTKQVMIFEMYILFIYKILA